METETLIVAERTCKDCGAPLGAGRDDRVYCDDACKTNFNNRKKRERRKAGEGQTGLKGMSDILNYKKGLSKEVIRKLATHFKVRQEAFDRPYKLK